MSTQSYVLNIRELPMEHVKLSNLQASAVMNGNETKGLFLQSSNVTSAVYYTNQKFKQ